MHIVIDVREACRPQPAGKGQWTRGCVRELLTRSVKITFLTDRDVPAEWAAAAGVTVRTLPAGAAWHVHAASWLQNAHGIDYYLSPTSYIVPFILGEQVRSLPVVHDMIAFRSEPHNRRAKLIERLTLKRAMERSHHIFTSSETTKRDLLKHYPAHDPKLVTPVFSGPLSAQPGPNQPDNRTILCAGTLCPRKNQLGLIQAYAALPEPLRTQYRLVLVGGRGWRDAEIVRLAEATAGVEWWGYVAEEDYEEILSTCAVFALPSLYEGFGLPVLDALQRGIPVLTSNRGSLPEVTGEAAVLVEPAVTCDITKGLTQLLEDDALRQRLRAAGPSQAAHYSWSRTVDIMMSVLT